MAENLKISGGSPRSNADLMNAARHRLGVPDKPDPRWEP